MKNQIICGDCLELLKEVEDKIIDIIITSPPYNLGNNHHTGSKKHSPYNDNMLEADYQQWQLDILDECYRVLKDDGSLFYNHKNRIKQGEQITPYSWLLKSPFIIKQEIVWFNGSQNFDKIRFYPMTERIYWLAKSPKTKLYNILNHHDLFDKKEWKAVGTKGSHTRAFPQKMVEDILRCFPSAQLVLDPFMGSGTTALGAIAQGRDYLGFELNQEYCDMANQRVLDSCLGLG